MLYLTIIIVFAVNGGLSVFWKDPGLARIIKQGAAVSATHAQSPAMAATYCWWLLRDTMHVFGASVLPDYLEDRFKLTRGQWQVAQLTMPVLTQLVTTPAHLMALDCYNEQGRQSVLARMRRVGKQYVGAAGVRMVRMWAPWSIGLLINRELRDYLNGDEHE